MRVTDTSNVFLLRPVPSGVPGGQDHFYFETPTAARVLVRVSRADLITFAAWITALTNGAEEIAAAVKEIER